MITKQEPINQQATQTMLWNITHPQSQIGAFSSFMSSFKVQESLKSMGVNYKRELIRYICETIFFGQNTLDILKMRNAGVTSFCKLLMNTVRSEFQTNRMSFLGNILQQFDELQKMIPDKLAAAPLDLFITERLQNKQFSFIAQVVLNEGELSQLIVQEGAFRLQITEPSQKQLSLKQNSVFCIQMIPSLSIVKNLLAQCSEECKITFEELLFIIQYSTVEANYLGDLLLKYAATLKEADKVIFEMIGCDLKADYKKSLQTL